MSLSVGIVGLPNVGKSTLFKAITKKQVDIANYPFCTIEPNIGVIEVPDERLKKLQEVSSAEKIVNATIKFYDIAGLVKGASSGEGLGNKFLSHIKEVDAIAHVVRFFENDDITHVNGTIDPKRDADIINLELILSDLEVVKKRIESVEKKARVGDKDSITRLNIYKKLEEILISEKMLHNEKFEEEEIDIIKELNLITIKPMFFIANVLESDVNKEFKIEGYENYKIIPISAKIESEISEMENEDDRKMFLGEIGLKESGLDKVIKFSYSFLNLTTYFTSGKEESKAWTITKGTNAKRAAREIHSDIEAGFIRAEIVSYNDFINNKGWDGVKNAGVCRTEGKDYIMQDGDVVYFLFNK